MNDEKFKKLVDTVQVILESTGDIYYHGSTHEISKFIDDFVGKGNDQYGPGIYFSSNRDDTLSYAGNQGMVYKCSLDTSKQLSKKTRYNAALCQKLMMASPDEYAYSDWDENKNVAIKNAMNNYIESYGRDMYEIIMQIWYDWYRDYPQQFVRNISQMGFDCTLHPSNTGSTFVVVYNPSIIKLIDKMPAQTIIDSLE